MGKIVNTEPVRKKKKKTKKKIKRKIINTK